MVRGGRFIVRLSSDLIPKWAASCWRDHRQNGREANHDTYVTAKLRNQGRLFFRGGTCPHLCRHPGADGCTPVVSAASLTVRTSSKTVTFAHPFLLKGVDRILAAGDYRVVTDEELIEELSFPVYRRVATMIFLPAESGSASTVEMVTIDPEDL